MARVTILCYHSIRDSGDPRVHASNVVSPTNFERQIRYLATRARVISLATYLDAVRQRRPLNEDCVVLTFDDGYRDSLTRVCPILQEYGLPATFFLATDFVGTGKTKWEDRLSNLVRCTPASQLVFLRGPLGEAHSFDLSGPRARLQAVERLISSLNGLPDGEREQTISRLEEQLQGCGYGHGLMLSWDDVRLLARVPGVTLGAHSMSHPRLSQLTHSELCQELLGSRARIESETGLPVRFFAYPYGDVPHPAGGLEQVLTEAGYQAALTLDYGANNRSSDLYRLKRLLVPDTSGLSFVLGTHLRASGAGEPLKRVYNGLMGR